MMIRDKMRYFLEPRYKTPCDEMIKLRQGLDERGIKWRDESDRRYIPIYRTKFEAADYFFSVIWGHGTYGQYEGLLECMSFAVDERGEPKGSMTAEEILSIVDRVRKGD